MKVFLTGGSGLLGKHLEKELDDRGIEHYSPAHAAFDVIEQRLGEVILWLDFKPDVVIHCAAVARYRDVETDLGHALRTNVVGTCHLIQECISHDIRMVYISTDHVFDGLDGPYGIDDKINPLTKYAKTKAAGELAVSVAEIMKTSEVPILVDTSLNLDNDV